jgi:drug/metabolite transporter (DMT)-like permease
LLAVGLSLIAASGFGLTSALTRVGLEEVNPKTGVLISLATSAGLTIALAFSLHADEILNLKSLAFVWFIFAGIVNFPLGRLLNFVSTRIIGAAKSSSIIGASPLVSTCLAVTIGTESVNFPILVGIFAVIGGLTIILSEYQ